MTQATLVYDDDCGFCTYWARRVATHAPLTLVGFSDLDTDLESRLPPDWESSAHLLTDDTVYSGGASMEEAVLYTPLGRVLRPPIEWLRRFDRYTNTRERIYEWIADNRSVLGQYMSDTPPARQQSN